MNTEELFLEKLKNGYAGPCPCCKRHAQVYRRAIHATAASQLVKLYRLGGDHQYVHTRELIPEGQSSIGDFSKAKHFGLIEDRPHDPDNKKTSGEWMLTAKGRDFVLGICGIPEFVMVFNDTVILEGNQFVKIEQCLGKTFNYTELMRGAA